MPGDVWKIPPNSWHRRAQRWRSVISMHRIRRLASAVISFVINSIAGAINFLCLPYHRMKTLFCELMYLLNRRVAFIIKSTLHHLRYCKHLQRCTAPWTRRFQNLITFPFFLSPHTMMTRRNRFNVTEFWILIAYDNHYNYCVGYWNM